MKKTIPQRIEALNAHRLTTYFAILGLEPIAIRKNATDYISPLGKNRAAILTVDHDSNSFTDPTNRKKGHLVDFICAWWRSNAEGDIPRHRTLPIVSALP